MHLQNVGSLNTIFVISKWKTQYKKKLKLIWKTSHCGWLFFLLFCYSFYFFICILFIYCGILLPFCDHWKFAIRVHFFLSSFDTEKHIHILYNTLHSAHIMINFKDAIIHFVLSFALLWFFLCVCVCSSTSYFLSSYFYLCGFLYVSNIKKPAYSFDAFPVYNLQIREKEWKKKMKENRNVANSPWHFTSFKWIFTKKKKLEEEFKWKSV